MKLRLGAQSEYNALWQIYSRPELFWVLYLLDLLRL